MASKKVITVNESSLVDLKAELYRKETQFKKDKCDSSLPKKAPIWQKKKKEKNVNKKNVVEKPVNEEYSKELEKSRLMLETKSALYDKLSSGQIEVPSDEDENDGRFLVDFHQKTKENEVIIHKDEITGSSMVVDPDNEWVDYVDSFGRSKKCLKKDLPLMKEKDEVLKPKLSLAISAETTHLSDDMRRELVRQNWEKEVEESLDKPIGPVHYEDVLAQEIRDHGVGYYKFSKAEEEREEQRALLNKLRSQTEQQRDKRERLLQKRKAAMDARLAKVKERKMKKLKEQGLITEEVKEADNTEENTKNITAVDGNEMTINNMVERIRNESTRIEKQNEWEKKKVDLSLFDKPKPKFPQYDPHSERNPDFAPPSSYAENKKDLKFRNKKTVDRKEHDHGLPSFNDNYNEDAIHTQTSDGPHIQTGMRQLPPQTDNIHAPSEYPQNNHAFQPPIFYNYNTPFLANIPTHLPPPPIHHFPPPTVPYIPQQSGTIPQTQSFPSSFWHPPDTQPAPPGVE